MAECSRAWASSPSPVSIASTAKGVGREEKDENLDPATKERVLRSGKARQWNHGKVCVCVHTKLERKEASTESCAGQILESRLIRKKGTQGLQVSWCGACWLERGHGAPCGVRCLCVQMKVTATILPRRS